MIEHTLASSEANRRFDKFLFQYLNNAPHSFIYRMLRKKRIKLNGKRAEGSEIILSGDRVMFYFSQETMDGLMTDRVVLESSRKLDIVDEDENILIVNKPSGLLSHSDHRGQTDTLLTDVLYYLKQTGAYDHSRYAAFTPALCNRLDRNTSGLVFCGKNMAALHALSVVFAERHADKEYLTVVHGLLSGSGVLQGYYHRDERTNKSLITPEPICDTLKQVTTAFEVIRQGTAHTLLRVKPITGRSHQIRAHLASIGHPIAGDVKYGGTTTPYAPAQLLHCHKLTIEQSEGLRYLSGRTWKAALPKNFSDCVREMFGQETEEL